MHSISPAYVVEIVTPKDVVLNGLWFGPRNAKRVVIFVHGLTGSLFSAHNIVEALMSPGTAALTFNNRGFEHVSEFKEKRGRHSRWHVGGAGHEVFTQSPDDIQGAINCVRRAGAKHIFLAGHSTGCQKAYYWASRGGVGVKGIILFGPLSDYSIAVKNDRRGRLAKMIALAKKMVRAGKSHELMPKDAMWFACDAQRFLSLHTSESSEEMFPYAHSKKPRAMQKVTTPTLVFLAGRDEHGDRPVGVIAKWFDANLRYPHRVVVVPRVGHGFKGGERTIARNVEDFMKENSP